MRVSGKVLDLRRGKRVNAEELVAGLVAAAELIARATVVEVVEVARGAHRQWVIFRILELASINVIRGCLPLLE